MRPDFLRHNLGLKAASLVLAMILWFFVIFKTQTEVSIDVEPQIKNVPETLSVAEKRPQTITVVIRGNERLLRRLRPEDIKVAPPLKEPTPPGRVFVPVELSDIKVPPHMVAVSSSPKGIWVILENKLKLMLPVEPSLKGEPAEGYSVQSVELSPDKAVIEGPAEEIKDLTYLTTEPYNITGAKSTQIDEVRIRRDVKAASVTPQEVRITVTVRRKN